MIRVVTKLSRAATTAARSGGIAFIRRKPPVISPSRPRPPPPVSVRSLCTNNGPTINPVAIQMINYALALARSRESDELYGQALLVLEQCLALQRDDNSKGTVLLAMSTLLYERGNFSEAIEKLQKVEDLNISSVGVRVAATEALVGLHLELGQDDIASTVADVCRHLIDTIEIEIGVGGFEVLDARIKAIEGIVKLVRGNIKKAEAFFQGAQEDKCCTGGFTSIACNMVSEEILLAATCALGQLEVHLGNFGDAEEILTRALTMAEKRFGSHHPKVGIVLTCIAFLFRHKAMREHSSSLLIQEGLYRRAIDLLSDPPLDPGGLEAKAHRRDILALARGGYAETLCIQQNRKAEGEKMKSWAESNWRNPRLTLAEALDISEPSSEVPVIDARISRVL
ncbi:tetratricopeptide repeat (TPR)-like superfamily protein [Actinidia rufa]|uniref:Tetratricopeptide repeat (TPR)-like superfamily protein n=1 Tax=Actinidia rufa TaxID=165716 RepID=A0A7J0F3I2_9ERIC|nr:tetratricopeptide repeat (TPR)-like superfamily protein [Actinidia rufa]